MMVIKELREEASELVNIDVNNLCYRSCWNCNGAHEHLKEADFVILCYECGKYYFKGVDITNYDGVDE